MAAFNLKIKGEKMTELHSLFDHSVVASLCESSSSLAALDGETRPSSTWSPDTRGTGLYIWKHFFSFCTWVVVEKFVRSIPLSFCAASSRLQPICSRSPTALSLNVHPCTSKPHQRPPPLPPIGQSRGCPLAGTVAPWKWSSLLRRTGCTRRWASLPRPSSSTASSSRGVTRGSPGDRACGSPGPPAQALLGSPFLKDKKMY